MTEIAVISYALITLGPIFCCALIWLKAKSIIKKRRLFRVNNMVEWAESQKLLKEDI